jgi:hypothetical protein
VTWKGEEMPLRSAQAKLAVLDDYADREELGALQADASATFNPTALELLAKGEALEAELTGEPRTSRGTRRRSRSRCASSSAYSASVEPPSTTPGLGCATAGSTGCSARAGRRPARFHSATCAGCRRSSRRTRRSAPSRSAWRRSRSLGFDMENDENIRLDLDDRPQKSPRACVIASDPPKVVHLITRAQGGLHDYQAFLHEAGTRSTTRAAIRRSRTRSAGSRATTR